LRHGVLLDKFAGLGLRLIFSLYGLVAVFPDGRGALGEEAAACLCFTVFLKEWHHAARDDQKVDR
jgi:hypothetical protein